jgi:hypothetical protein
MNCEARSGGKRPWTSDRLIQEALYRSYAWNRLMGGEPLPLAEALHIDVHEAEMRFQRDTA